MTKGRVNVNVIDGDFNTLPGYILYISSNICRLFDYQQICLVKSLSYTLFNTNTSFSKELWRI